MLRSLRRAVAQAEADGKDWRLVVDQMRTVTADIWGRWPPGERARVLRHVRSFWESRRRRVAPETAAALVSFEQTGRLRQWAGRINGVERTRGGRFRVAVSKAGVPFSLETDWIINCTGPGGDIRQRDDALVTDLCAQGLIRPHETCIGIDAAPDGRVIDSAGMARSDLYTIGPLLRGVLYESVSVLELRVQVADLAQRLLERSARSRQGPIGLEETRVRAHSP